MSDRRSRRGAGRSADRRSTPALADRDATGPRPLASERFQSAARWLAVFALAALVVIATLVPSDSVAVEQGGALPLLPIAALAWIASLVSAAPRSSRLDLLFDALVWSLAIWMWVATAAVSGTGDVRAAMNEAWWWTTAAAVLAAARRSLPTDRGGAALLVLLIALASALAVQAAHQQWVTLPAERARYEAAPEKMIEQFQQETGIAAPPGSPQRALFEGRLYGGGPTATFALQNSLAAYLIIGIMLAGGVLVRVRLDRVAAPRVAVASALAVVLCALALLWTASRSALLAVVLVGGGAIAWSLLSLQQSPASRSRTTAATRSRTPMIAAGLAAVVVGMAIAGTSLHPDWFRGDAFAGARRSLQYRLDYWQATLDMLADHPWFGAGPGNFQDRYATYRLDRASEGIADPHNWVMETWAAGGTPAVLLLAAAMVSGWLIVVRRPGLPDGGCAPRRWAVATGAAAGLVGALVAWISQRYLPDVDALGLSVLAAIAIGVALRPLGERPLETGPLGRTPPITRRAIAGPAIIAVAVHLLAAGGWTVPGVAVPLLVLIAVAVGPPRPPGAAASPGAVASPGAAASPSAAGRRCQWIGVAIGVAILIAWWAFAWLPHGRVAEHLARGNAAFAAGRLDVAIAAFRAAEHADPLDPDPAVRRADAWRWIIVQHDDSPAARRHWQEAWEAAIGDNRASASLWSGRAEHRLHFFQRWGDRDDLLRAREDLLQGAALSRSDVRLAAQLAVLEAALGDLPAAERWRERAERLAAAGGHADRQLSVVQILPAERLGSRAQAGPLRVAASSRLSADKPPGEPR